MMRKTLIGICLLNTLLVVIAQNRPLESWPKTQEAHEDQQGSDKLTPEKAHSIFNRHVKNIFIPNIQLLCDESCKHDQHPDFPQIIPVISNGDSDHWDLLITKSALDSLTLEWKDMKEWSNSVSNYIEVPFVNPKEPEGFPVERRFIFEQQKNSGNIILYMASLIGSEEYRAIKGDKIREVCHKPQDNEFTGFIIESYLSGKCKEASYYKNGLKANNLIFSHKVKSAQDRECAIVDTLYISYPHLEFDFMVQPDEMFITLVPYKYYDRLNILRKKRLAPNNNPFPDHQEMKTYSRIIFENTLSDLKKDILLRQKRKMCSAQIYYDIHTGEPIICFLNIGNEILRLLSLEDCINLLEAYMNPKKCIFRAGSNKNDFPEGYYIYWFPIIPLESSE